MKTDFDHFKEHFASVKDRELNVPVHAKVSSLAWNADGSRLAIASSDSIVRLWDMSAPLSSCRDLLTLTGNGKNVLLEFHPLIPNILAVCDRRLQLVDTSTGKVVFETDHDYNSRPLNIALNHDGSLIAVGLKSEEIHCYKILDGQVELLWRHKCAFEANQFQFTANDTVVVAGGPGNLRCISSDGQSIEADIPCANGSLQSVAHCRRFTVVDSADAIITVFGHDDNMNFPQDWLVLSSICRPEWPVRHLSLSHDSLFLAAAGDDRHIDISLMPTGESVFRLPVDGAVLACRWHPTRYLLAFAPERLDKNGRPELKVKVFGYSQ